MSITNHNYVGQGTHRVVIIRIFNNLHNGTISISTLEYPCREDCSTDWYWYKVLYSKVESWTNISPRLNAVRDIYIPNYATMRFLHITLLQWIHYLTVFDETGILLNKVRDMDPQKSSVTENTPAMT